MRSQANTAPVLQSATTLYGDGQPIWLEHDRWNNHKRQKIEEFVLGATHGGQQISGRVLNFRLTARERAMKFVGPAAAAILLFGVQTGAAAADCRIPDYTEQYPIPTGHESDPRFKLSVAFPTQLPKQRQPWEGLSFDSEWQKYLSAALDKALSELDDDLLPKNVAGKTEWFHVPWMDGGPRGREYSHGLTKERGPDPQDISENPQLPGKQGWAVGVYNAVAGYTLGKVFASPCDPDLSKALFEPGAATVKFLFTDATPAEIPWLAGTLKWSAHINPATGGNSRTLRDVYLIQVDVGVRDPNASETGWVFGTFVFDSGSPSKPPAKWRDGLVPLSIQWGNDPNANADDPKTQTHVNAATPTKHFGWAARKTLGWYGRANGPIDNIISSCLSCHGSAQFPRSAKYSNFWDKRKYPNMTDDERRKIWFKAVKPGELFDSSQSGSIPLDYSLQLQTAMEHFCGGVGKTITPPPASCQSFAQILSTLSPAEAAEAMMPTTRGDTEAQ